MTFSLTQEIPLVCINVSFIMIFFLFDLLQIYSMRTCYIIGWKVFCRDGSGKMFEESQMSVIPRPF